MAMTTMSIRVEEQDKKQFDLFCDQTGMNASVAVNMFVKKVLQEHRLPFAVEIPFQPEQAARNRERLLAAINSKKIPNITLTADENGRAIIDKEINPDLYDWAVNG
ncbi:MAG: type II toxin-antitoxin system RelB/DinJ family antitoxin [Oscillospiraceae bacterium]|jgi:DNA-damage-inducible protein J|nr:type II toxin-antitoxin system RelB/DinJ family antitoxin [Oscillospiraceae bacterium]